VLGATKSALRFADGDTGRLSDLVGCYRHFLSNLAGSLLYYAMAIGGPFLSGFILSEAWRMAATSREPASAVQAFFAYGAASVASVVGTIWAIKFSFFRFSIVDRGVGPIRALKDSSIITRCVKWQLLVFYAALLGVNLLGCLCLGVGLFVTIPITYLAAAHVYRHLQPRLDSVEPSLATPTET